MSRLNPAPPARSRARRSIWFTGENVRPPYGEWDGYLSFDLDPLGGRNAYFPLWWETLSTLGKPTFNFTGSQLTIDSAMSDRPPTMNDRPHLACAFIGNPTPDRFAALQALAQFGRVDTFGAAVGAPVADKIVTARRYKFVVCFENDYFPGYVTEKPFDAWATGAIPIWWGSDPLGYINASAMLNRSAYGGVYDMAEHAAAIATDQASLVRMSQQAILTREPDLSGAEALVQRVLS